jgi:hypothetical protein
MAYDLQDPCVRIAAMGSGDTPDEIRRALMRAVSAGWDFDRIWEFVGTLGAHDSVVEAVDAQLAGAL